MGRWYGQTKNVDIFMRIMLYEAFDKKIRSHDEERKIANHEHKSITRMILC